MTIFFYYANISLTRVTNQIQAANNVVFSKLQHVHYHRHYVSAEFFYLSDLVAVVHHHVSSTSAELLGADESAVSSSMNSNGSTPVNAGTHDAADALATLASAALNRQQSTKVSFYYFLVAILICQHSLFLFLFSRKSKLIKKSRGSQSAQLKALHLLSVFMLFLLIAFWLHHIIILYYIICRCKIISPIPTLTYRNFLQTIYLIFQAIPAYRQIQALDINLELQQLIHAVEGSLERY